MQLIAVGDKSRYQFLRSILDEQVAMADPSAFQSESLSKNTIRVVSKKTNLSENCIYSKKIPLQTEMVFPDEINLRQVECGVNDKLLFFDEFPYRTDEKLANLASYMQKNRVEYCEIILVRNARRFLESDISTEDMALEEACRQYEKEQFPVNVFYIGEQNEFLFWSQKSIVVDDMTQFKKKLDTLKEKIDFSFDLDYELSYVAELEMNVNNPSLLDTFIQYSNQYQKKDVLKNYALNANNYFWEQNAALFETFYTALYEDYMKEVCLWNMDKDLNKLKNLVQKEFLSFIYSNQKFIFHGTKDEYAYFLNEHKEKVIEFKSKVVDFFQNHLCMILKTQMYNHITKLEEIMDEKIY